MRLLYVQRVVLVAAVLLIAWLVMVLARVENQRYALLLNMCPGDAITRLPDAECLARVQTRTGWWWHLYYAAMDFGTP